MISFLCFIKNIFSTHKRSPGVFFFHTICFFVNIFARRLQTFHRYVHSIMNRWNHPSAPGLGLCHPKCSQECKNRVSGTLCILWISDLLWVMLHWTRSRSNTHKSINVKHADGYVAYYSYGLSAHRESPLAQYVLLNKLLIEEFIFSDREEMASWCRMDEPLQAVQTPPRQLCIIRNK